MTSFDLQTLERIVNFRDEFLNQTEQDDPKFPFAVVRNKTDLYDEGSSVTEQKSEQYFNEHFDQSTCKHFSTSAKVIILGAHWYNSERLLNSPGTKL